MWLLLLNYVDALVELCSCSCWTMWLFLLNYVVALVQLCGFLQLKISIWLTVNSVQAQALPTIGHLHPEFTKVRRVGVSTSTLDESCCHSNSVQFTKENVLQLTLPFPLEYWKVRKYIFVIAYFLLLEHFFNLLLSTLTGILSVQRIGGGFLHHT